jgi:hypothetical protein
MNRRCLTRAGENSDEGEKLEKTQSRLIVAAGIAAVLSTAAIALGLASSWISTTDAKAASRIPVNAHAWTRMDQDDLDVHLSGARADTETVCRLGARSERN